MTRVFKASLGLFIVACAAVPSSASVSSGYVTAILTDLAPNNGYAFSVSGARTKPACATEDLWVIPNPTAAKSQDMYSTVLTGYANGRPVRVTGTGACDTVFPNREVVAYIALN